ncbi:MAG TPA: CcdB family protein [Povalibacter sp.]|uniref:CcdB family protein n=1 Tax=Povalibacter sp. TaxID=1962978 RepID=UPI002C7FF1BE|nr:CcdB family protein [Povalibacter sp.]HMN44106.1 CcdB family protein [Povalibacter sp.]
MAQFSVHKNKNPKTRSAYPYLVDIQSDLLSGLSTRVVVPLIKHAALLKKPVRNLMPVVEVDGQPFLLLVPQLAGIATSELGPAVGTIAERRTEVVAALDFLITGI